MVGTQKLNVKTFFSLTNQNEKMKVAIETRDIVTAAPPRSFSLGQAKMPPRRKNEKRSPREAPPTTVSLLPVSISVPFKEINWL